MKKLLTSLLIIFFFVLPTSFSLAQTDGLENSVDDTDIEIVEDEQDNQEEQETEQQKEQESLADTLEQTQEEEIQPQRRSFWTILGAILIPSIFLILCYFMLKFFQA